MVNKETRDELIEALLGFSGFVTALVAGVASMEDDDDPAEVRIVFDELAQTAADLAEFAREVDLFDGLA